MQPVLAVMVVLMVPEAPEVLVHRLEPRAPVAEQPLRWRSEVLLMPAVWLVTILQAELLKKLHIQVETLPRQVAMEVVVQWEQLAVMHLVHLKREQPAQPVKLVVSAAQLMPAGWWAITRW